METIIIVVCLLSFAGLMTFHVPYRIDKLIANEAEENISSINDGKKLLEITNDETRSPYIRRAANKRREYLVWLNGQ